MSDVPDSDSLLSALSLCETLSYEGGLVSSQVLINQGQDFDGGN
jgi:hypothetical protein